MWRVINSTYMSVDGVVQKPKRWTFDYRSEDPAQYALDLLFSADAVIMGRRNGTALRPARSTRHSVPPSPWDATSSMGSSGLATMPLR